jgi:hypothetical protein
LDVARKVLMGKKCVCDLEIEVENMEISCTLILAMEKLLKIYHIVLFYLEDIR